MNHLLYWGLLSVEVLYYLAVCLSTVSLPRKSVYMAVVKVVFIIYLVLLYNINVVLDLFSL